MPTTQSEAHLALTAEWSANTHYERAYLDANRLNDGLMMFVAAKDLARPGIAVSVLEALLYMGDAVRTDLLDRDAAVLVVEIRNFDIGPHIKHDGPFMQWAVTARVYCASGEIREMAYDCEQNEWTGPWFDFDTAVVR